MYPTFPWIIAIVLLMGISAFCSASESALFSLTGTQVRKMSNGSPTERRVAMLLSRSAETLLGALLLTNLVANMLYFSIVSIFTLRIQHGLGTTKAGFFSTAALILMICLCEILPKGLALAIPQIVSRLASGPVSILICALKPFLFLLSLVARLSTRLVAPSLHVERSIDLLDLERAIQISEKSPTPLQEEKRILRNIVSLSEMEAEEVMRPRSLLPIVSAPVGLDAFNTLPPGCDWLFIRDFSAIEGSDSDEIAYVFPAARLPLVPSKGLDSLEKYAIPAIYAPWNASAGSLLNTLRTQKRETIVIINEYGETIGAVLLSDINEIVFSENAERVFRLTHEKPIRETAPGRWVASGFMNMRDFSDFYGIKKPDSDAATLGGFLMELLEKIPQSGDECAWDDFSFRVLSHETQEKMKVEILRSPKEKK
ncbi:MAG: CNNM domain-containing protein [Planctomycetia bacterium]|nr:CNNM domain-containing protein [Planctomycetia bacterium]